MGGRRRGAASRLYRNRGDGTFADVTATAGLDRRGWGQGVCAGDYDNDGHVDLFVTYYGQSVLYRNHGRRPLRRRDRAQRACVAPDRYSTGCAFLDYDRDGRLDLFVSAYVAYDDALRYPAGHAGAELLVEGPGRDVRPRRACAALHNVLYRGHADGTFTDVSERAGILKAAPSFGFTPLVLDYDNDGWPDVYVANDSRASLLFHNERDGTFKERGLMAGAALTADGRAQAGMGVAAADYDRDGWLDIAKTNFDDDTTSLYRNLGDGAFEDATSAAGPRRQQPVPGLGRRLSRLRPRRLARPPHRQRPRLPRGRPRRRALRVRAAEGPLPQPGRRPVRGRLAQARARPSRSGRPPAAPPSATCSNRGRAGRRGEQHERRAEPAPRLRARGTTAARWCVQLEGHALEPQRHRGAGDRARRPTAASSTRSAAAAASARRTTCACTSASEPASAADRIEVAVALGRTRDGRCGRRPTSSW